MDREKLRVENLQSRPLKCKVEVMKSGDVYCTKNEVPVICKPERRKDRQSWFPKWWCYNCKRYVLPDNDYHKLCVTRRKA